MGVGLATAARRLLSLGILVLATAPLAVACAPADSVPDLSSREAFARSVMAAAASGSVEQVESLVIPDRINVRPEAQQLLDSTRGWAPGSWQLRLSNDFPEVANVEVYRNGRESAVRYAISWTRERWALIMGQPKNPPSGGAGLGTGAAPSASQLPADCSDASVEAGTGAATLVCQQFTSTAGNAPGHNLYWLTSTPLRLRFDRMNASLTLVVRMPCGVLNVPVTVDAFSLTPVPGGLVESADGCTGPASDQRSWTTAFFKEPLIYQLDARTLTFTNGSGQIRFARD